MHCLFCFAVIPIILSDITDLSDEGRDMVNFTCIAIGEPTPDISWYFNDIMINAPYDSIKYMIVSEPFNITTTASILILHNATASDVGVYTCTASNTLGNDTSHGKETLYWNIGNKLLVFRLFIWYGISNMWHGNKLWWLQHCW